MVGPEQTISASLPSLHPEAKGSRTGSWEGKTWVKREEKGQTGTGEEILELASVSHHHKLPTSVIPIPVTFRETETFVTELNEHLVQELKKLKEVVAKGVADSTTSPC